VGLKTVAAGIVALVLAGPGAAPSIAYLQSREAPGGGFAETRGAPSPQLTAWVVLGLRAADAPVSAETRRYLAGHDDELHSATDLALVLLARGALGERPSSLIVRLRALERSNGAFGPTVNGAIWSALALRQVGQPVSRATVRYLLRRQASSGGWSWSGRGADSNDTAAAVQALRALGVSGGPVRRGLAYLRRVHNRDGGFELVPGRGSDAQSTAWAIQAFAAARAPVPKGALAYLARLRRRDGSYRYSARYAATPVWVTAQVLPALVRRPFPLRR
jgi:prenyltransferase beta subunit